MRLLISAFTILLALSTAACAQSSSSIRNSIFSQIENAGLRGWDLSVDARYGKVTLDGKVASEKDRQTVEAIAARTDGVERIENNLTVTGENPYRDTALEQSIRSELMARPDLKNFNFEVTEAEGAVVLSGEAQTEKEAKLAEKVARSHSGVKEVRNRITVRAPLSDSELAENVRSTLSREGDISMAGLDVAARSGTVVLRGQRPDFRDIDRILSLAMMVDGVKDVRSEMTVGQQGYMEAPGTAK